MFQVAMVRVIGLVSLLVAGPAGGDGAWRRRDLLCSSKKIARFQVEPGD